MKTMARINPGKTADGTNFRPGLDLRLHVFAKGTATRVTTKEVVRVADRNGEGQITGHHNETKFRDHDQENVDWIEYKLTNVAGDVTIALWRCAGSGSACSWSCPLFTASNESGMFSAGKIRVQTNEGWDPLLGLLIAQLCSTEYCPSQLKSDFVPRFPGRNQYRNSGRPNGRFHDPWAEQGRPEDMISGSAYSDGIAIEPGMFCALPDYKAEYFVNPPEDEPDTPPVLTMVPAHMETNEDGLLIFVPIRFVDLTPPPEIAAPDGAPEDDADDEPPVTEDDSSDEE